ncbi:hypothetical protein, partial [Microbacterium sp. K36]|uniref:hypothetical protein n=1 Tax=Microbacterium sp. K36 TaxID=2305439 RepID=UPI00197BAFD3
MPGRAGTMDAKNPRSGDRGFFCRRHAGGCVGSFGVVGGAGGAAGGAGGVVGGAAGGAGGVVGGTGGIG